MKDIAKTGDQHIPPQRYRREFEEFSGHRYTKYLAIHSSWRWDWQRLTMVFDYPPKNKNLMTGSYF